MPTGPGGDVSGPLSAGWPAQERPPRGVRRRLRHLHLSCAAGGGRRGARLSPTEDVARGGLSATVAPPCPGAPEARRAVLRADHPTPAAALTICRTALGQLPLAAPPALDWQTVCAQRGAAHPERCPPAGSGSCVPASSRVAVRHRLYGLGHSRHEADTRHAAGRSRSGGWCVWRWPGGVSPPAGQWSGELRGPSLRTTAPPGRRSGPVAGGRMGRCRGTNSIARRSPRVRPHPYAVSPTKCYRKCSGPGVRLLRGSLS